MNSAVRSQRARLAGLGFGLAVALTLGACSGDSGSSAESNPTVEKPVKPAPVTPRAVEAPEAGSVLASASGSGRFNAVTNGEGFAIVRSLLDISGEEGVDESTVTVYDAAGTEISKIPSGKVTGECGAADIVVGGGQRLILTELISTRPAEGIHPERTSLDLMAWDAKTGDAEWTAHVVPPQRDGLSCDAYDGRLQDFASTYDGRWGIYGSVDAKIIDLRSGRMRASRKDPRVLGNYFVGSDDIQDYPDSARPILDPATEKALGTIKGIEFYNEPDLAPAGLFDTMSEGSSPPAGLSSDGRRLIGVTDRSTDEYVAAYALPSGAARWRAPKTFSPYIAGDAGGILLMYRDNDSSHERELWGLDDTTGRKKWVLPEGDVCGITDNQMLLSVNDQLAVIDIQTGKQLSYSEPDDAECPEVLPGGIGVSTGTDDPTQPHSIRVTQLLEP